MKFVNCKLASAEAKHEKEEKRLKRKIGHVQRELEGERQRLNRELVSAAQLRDRKKLALRDLRLSVAARAALVGQRDRAGAAAKAAKSQIKKMEEEGKEKAEGTGGAAFSTRTKEKGRPYEADFEEYADRLMADGNGHVRRGLSTKHPEQQGLLP